jgi:glutathione synthase/RimK-type ligase-like ATP-grasp enzyme
MAAAFVVNRPRAMASNNSKPYQLELIRGLGFLTPETLLTTDRAAAEEFWEAHGQVVYKSVSGVRSIVSRLAERHVGRMPDVATCPTQFQEYVGGTDVRVHVVGDEVIATKVESAADDYRYAQAQGSEVKVTPMDIPEQVEAAAIRVARRLGLAFAGIDLRVTEEGDWYCFEVNPSPAFSYYEAMGGQRIDEAVARLLASRD